MSNDKSKSPAAKTASATPPPTPNSTSEPAPAHTPPLFRRIDWFAFIVSTVLVMAGYYYTLAPNLTLEDSGELAVASMYAGIPHPPGYPVWTIYTWLWTLLPVGNIAWRVALGSAFAGALGCGVLGLLVSRGSSMMMEGIGGLKDISRRWESAICIVTGIVAAMLLGFNGYMWSQSVIVEVYSSCVLALTCVLLGLIRWTYAPHQFRYLYLAFFAYGICICNHQSLLVIALGMEVWVLAVQRKLARDLFFWNSICYAGGLIAGGLGYFTTLTGNPIVFVIFNLIGIGSFAVWVWLAVTTKIKAAEIKRDLVLLGVIAFAALSVLSVTGHVSRFQKEVGAQILFALVAAGGAFYFYNLYRQTKTLSREWLVALLCGAAFAVGASFYLWMAISGMTNPPMQWGYPRTVEGFFHALTRGQYEKIKPTSGTGDSIGEYVTSLISTYTRQVWLYLDGTAEEFNWAFILVALVIFAFVWRMQKRERAIVIGIGALFITLGPFLIFLLNPPPDRQARELIRVFFTASHVLIAMGVGYGLSLIAANLATNYQNLRRAAIAGSVIAIDIAIYALAVNTHNLLGDTKVDAVASEAVRLQSSLNWLGYIFILISVASIGIIAYRFYLAETDPKEDLPWLICLGALGSGALFFGIEFIKLKGQSPGVEYTSLVGITKAACWIFAALCLHLGSRKSAAQNDRRIPLVLGGVAALVSVVMTYKIVRGDTAGLTGLRTFFTELGRAFNADQYAMPVFANLILLGTAVVLTVAFVLWRKRAPIGVLLLAFAAMPVHSIMCHWFENEQRAHMFGYWFGHDMFTPPFNGPDGKLSYDPKLRAEMMKDPAKAKLIYPEMARDAILYGGTDPGRFCPTYTIFCESFIPPECKKDTDPLYDRRDVYIITQNALADGTYLNYIRAHYNRSAQYKYDSPFFQELLRGPAERENNYSTNFIARTAASLLDKPFTALGASVEKRRRIGSSYFTEEHFLNLKTLAAKLAKPENDFSMQVASALKPETRALLSSGSEKALARALADDLNTLIEVGVMDDKPLIANVNQEREAQASLKVIQEEKQRLNQQQASPLAFQGLLNREAAVNQSIATIQSDRKRLTEEVSSKLTSAGAPVSSYLKGFIYEVPQQSTRIRLQRLLIEAAFPAEIIASKGGVYPDREMQIASPEDSQKCFGDYLGDAQRRLALNQLRPGEDVRVIDGRVQVSGQVAVMAINGLLTKVMFDKNPTNEFYVEESFPLDWMYPHLQPFGVIMHINREKMSSLSEDVLARDHHFWSQFSDRLIGNWITYDTPVKDIVEFAEKTYLRRDFSGYKGDRKFVRDDQAQKAFSKLRSSIGGVYSWRLTQAPPEFRPKTEAELRRLYKETDFAFKQAFAFCPYSPEAVFRYINLLVQPPYPIEPRYADALLVAETCKKLDPYNGQVVDLVNRLRQAQQSAGDFEKVRSGLAKLEAEVRDHPTNFQSALNLAASYIQTGNADRGYAILDGIVTSPKASASAVQAVIQAYMQMQQWGKLEMPLERLCTLMPGEPETWYDLAALRVTVGKVPDAYPAISNCIAANSARLARNPKARDLAALIRTDERFNGIRNTPEYQKLMP